MSNIIKAQFLDESETRLQSEPLFQYDYGQVLDLSAINGLPATFEAHFCNKGDPSTTTGTGSDGKVTIPDAYIQTGKYIIVYVYLHTGDGDGETEYKITIPVATRPSVTHEEPTPVQQAEIEQVYAALQNEAAKAEAFADDAKESADRAREEALTALAEAKASGEFDGKDGTDGRDGVDGKDGVDGVSPAITGAKSGKVTTLTIVDAEHPGGATLATIEDGRDVSSIFALPFFASGRIPLQAHKGLFSTLPTGGPPEESIGAFELAGKGGIRFCEADIRLTADGLPICLHDATLNRTTTGTGNANALTLAELRELRLKWPDGTVSEELIPTLDEYLYVCKKYGMIAVIELKEVRVAGFMDAVLAKINECGMMDQCILIQSVANIDRIRAVTDLPVLLITADSNWNDTYAYLQSDQCKLIGLTMDKSPNLTTDIPAKIAACHQLGIPCEVYTCNTKAEADAYFAMGADIVNTDILTESDWLGGAVDAAMSDSSENAVQNKIVKGYVDAADADLQEQINALVEPFRVKQFIVDPNATIPSVTQDVANTQIPKILLTITGQEATDYQIIGMISYEAFDATSGGNRLNFIPVCQFTGGGQTELSIRGCIMGPNSKTMRRFDCWVLLKRRQGGSA